MRKEKIKFNRIVLQNRWRQCRYSRNSDWVIIGVQRWYAGPEDFCYKIAFLGIELKIWFKKQFIKP